MPETEAYQIYFRITRGGTGIPYTLAKTEFLSVFESYSLNVIREYAVRRRMWVEMRLSPTEVKRLAPNLGYTGGILHQHFAPYEGELLSPVETGRWYLGWVRQGDCKVYQTEVFAQDNASLLNESPDRREFILQRDGQTTHAKGHHPRRALSALDARFLLNVARIAPATRLLDAFAGYGGIIFEARRRGIRAFAADIEPTLAPGLAALAPQRYFIGDARSLPLQTQAVDTIVSEPPFRIRYRQAVMDALPELRRVLKPHGRIILLIALDMRDALWAALEAMCARVREVQVIPRDSGMQCPVLDISFTE